MNSAILDTTQPFIKTEHIFTLDKESTKMESITPEAPQPLVKINRVLTPNEHRFLNAPNSNISLVVRVSGKITAPQFQAAVAKARVKHPLLGVKIQYDEAYRGWFINEDVPMNPIRTLVRTRDDQWYDELQKEHRIYLDLTCNSLIRFVLLTGEENGDFIIFANHAICDGLSLSYLARDIVYFLAHPEEMVTTPLVPVPMDDENTTVSLRAGALTQFVMNRMQQKWQASPAYFEPEEFQSLHTAFWRGHFYNLYHTQLSETETRQLIQACRAHSITVNTAICAAFRGAIHTVHTEHKKYMDVLGVAVDIRDKMRIKQKDFFGFSASGIAPTFRYNSKIDFWTNAQKLHQRIQKQLRKGLFVKNLAQKSIIPPTISDAMQVAVLGRMMQPGDPHYEKITQFRQDSNNVVVKMLKKKGVLDSDEKQLGVLCTNLGRMSYPATFGPYRIESMMFTPSSGLLMECVLGVVTIGGKLNLTAGNIADYDSEAELEELTQIALNFLF